MALFVAYDLTRLFLGPAHVTPRGIDRVDIGYARHFLQDWSGDAVATLLTPFGARVIDRQRATRLVDCAEAYWKEQGDPDSDPLWPPLKQALIEGATCKNVFRKNSRSRQVLGMAGHALRHGGCLFRSSGADALPDNAVYLNTGQMGIAVPQFLSWLKTRPDIRSVFMLHDLIPLEFAHFVPAASRRFHNNMVANTVRHAAGLITTTEVMGVTIRRELLKRGRTDLPVLAQALPVSPRFANGRDGDAALAEAGYFVIVSSIEPRKNHDLLLNVWRELVRTNGAGAPKLVIVGTRWHGHQAVTGPLKREPQLNVHVIEVGGLTTPALHRLLSNARGLLMPSFAEGFGLPIIEALALGVPVIASDIATHREAGGPAVTYLGAGDTAGWEAAIRGLMERSTHPPLHSSLATWPGYFRKVEPFLSGIAAARQKPRWRGASLTGSEPTAA